MCLKPVSVSENSTKFPLHNVNWESARGRNKNCKSPVMFSYNPPGSMHIVFYEKFMAFYYLHIDLQNWFTEMNAKFALLWDEDQKLWLLDIFDKHVAVLFKLSWSQSEFFNEKTL